MVRSEREVIDEECLEEVCFIVNRRPLGTTEEGSIVTPALLAWGSNCIQGTDKLVNVRRYFYENLFAMQRRRHMPSRHQRRAILSVGTNVLFQYGHGDKAEFHHDVGQVVAIDGSSLTIRAGRKSYKVASSAIIPLNAYFQSQVGQESSPGGHVVNLGDEI